MRPSAGAHHRSAGRPVDGSAVDPERRSTERRDVLPPSGCAVSSNHRGANTTRTPTSEDQSMTATNSPLTTQTSPRWRSSPDSCASIRSGRQHEAGSGHPTSSMSAADLAGGPRRPPPALRLGPARGRRQRPPDLLQGPRVTAAVLGLQGGGVVSDEELMSGYRRFGSRLQGHPTPVLPWVDVATGSLGQGLPDGVGVALAGKYLDELPYRVWVLCGDSEMAEGSIWEALRQGRLLRTGQPHRDRRREPSRPARPDRARLGPRRLRGQGRGVRLPCHRHRRPRPATDRERPRSRGRTTSARP